MKHPVVAAALVTGAVVLGASRLSRRLDRPRPAPSPKAIAEDFSCVSAREPVDVRGQSLGRLLPPGSSLTLLRDYYRCNDVRRGDVVALRFGGDASPLAKVVHALPGDRFSLEETPTGERMVVNGEVARNSEGTPYAVDAAAQRMLGEYVRGFHGVIPPDAYLVLGDRATRTTDSRVFGLVAKGDLLGKLMRARP